MRTLTIEKTVYTFDELSESAKETARDWYRDSMEQDDWTGRDAIESRNAFLREFNADFRRGNQCSIRVDGGYANEDDISELSYVRLWKYLNANHADCLAKIGDCQFAGVCWDETLLDGIAEFMRKPYRVDFESLLYSCCEDLRIAVDNEVEYQNSDEVIDESIRCNEYEFTENGRIA